MKTKKILYLINDASFFISHRLPTALSAIKNDYQVHVVSNMNDNKSYLETLGFICHDVNFRRSSMNILYELKIIFKIFSIFRKIEPDLYCHETIKPVLYGTLVSKFLPKKPIVNTITGLGYLFISQKKIHIFFQRVLLLVYRVIFSSKIVYTIFENKDDANLFIDFKVVNNRNIIIIRGAGVDIEKIKPSKSKTKRISIVLVARMLWDKGIGEFVEAARVVKANYDVSFVLVGGEDIENPKGISKKILKEWADEGIVDWKGFSTEVDRILNDADIACLPSYREGLPKFLIEAAAAGLPIVTTDVPGCREVVKNNVNGIIVPPKNSKLLSEALIKLIKDNQARHKMGLQSRKFAEEEFSLSLIIKETLGFYKKILKN
tara:strand:+ start:1050 stop:2177 length:1128 start_codon:yes stop_codon:yes gene_type:complete